MKVRETQANHRFYATERWVRRVEEKKKAKTEWDKAKKRFKTKKAIKMKHEPTEAENKLWNSIKDHQLGTGFKHQVLKHKYILDFYSPQSGLCVEVDGGYHNQRKLYDLNRDADLWLIGIRTIRFTNDEVLNDLDRVLADIKKHM